MNIPVVTLYDHLGKDNDADVILWGNGYGATLAAFAKRKYPHLIDGVSILCFQLFNRFMKCLIIFMLIRHGHSIMRFVINTLLLT